MIDQDVTEYVSTEPPEGLKVEALREAIESMVRSAPFSIDSETLRLVIRAARNWLLVERLPELLQPPGEPELQYVELNVSSGRKFSVIGWIDQENPIDLVDSVRNTPAEALKDAFAKI